MKANEELIRRAEAADDSRGTRQQVFCYREAWKALSDLGWLPEDLAVSNEVSSSSVRVERTALGLVAEIWWIEAILGKIAEGHAYGAALAYAGGVYQYRLSATGVSQSFHDRMHLAELFAVAESRGDSS